jgi:hypothetical protein
MKTKLAVDIFSKRTIEEIQENGENADGTLFYLRVVQQFKDSVLSDEKIRRSDDLKLQNLLEVYEAFEAWKAESTNPNNLPTEETLYDLILCTKGLVEMVQQLMDEHHVDYVILKYIGQNIVENWFCLIRQGQKGNTNVTNAQYREISETLHSTGSKDYSKNLKPSLNFTGLPFVKKKNEKDKKTFNQEVLKKELNILNETIKKSTIITSKTVEDRMSYISGYILFKIKKKNKTDSDLIDYCDTFIESSSGITMASDSFIQFIYFSFKKVFFAFTNDIFKKYTSNAFSIILQILLNDKEIELEFRKLQQDRIFEKNFKKLVLELLCQIYLSQYLEKTNTKVNKQSLALRIEVLTHREATWI